MNTAKQEAKELIEKLPPTATWDDIFYQLYVRQKISQGIKAAEESKMISHEEVKKKYNVQ